MYRPQSFMIHLLGVFLWDLQLSAFTALTFRCCRSVLVHPEKQARMSSLGGGGDGAGQRSGG